MKVQLILDGQMAAEIDLADGERIIGSASPSKVLIEDPSVSPTHAKVYQQSGKVYIVDIGSQSGTYVNGKRISGPVALRSGTPIKLGDFDFQVMIAAADIAGGAGSVSDNKTHSSRDAKRPLWRSPIAWASFVGTLSLVGLMLYVMLSDSPKPVATVDASVPDEDANSYATRGSDTKPSSGPLGEMAMSGMWKWGLDAAITFSDPQVNQGKPITFENFCAASKMSGFDLTPVNAEEEKKLALMRKGFDETVKSRNLTAAPPEKRLSPEIFEQFLTGYCNSWIELSNNPPQDDTMLDPVQLFLTQNRIPPDRPSYAINDYEIIEITEYDDAQQRSLGFDQMYRFTLSVDVRSRTGGTIGTRKVLGKFIYSAKYDGGKLTISN